MHLATRDGLTGLYVIRYFRILLNQALLKAKEGKEPLSLILIDLDNFKEINDTYGHQAGDEILREVAGLLQSFVEQRRPDEEVDCVGRYGGEEFIILLRNCSLEEATGEVAEKLREKVQKSGLQWEGKRVPVRLSAGVATLHKDEDVPDLIVQRADQALYVAKRRGKNKVCSEKELDLSRNTRRA
jgi:diguanylate cyclase (GGDEF)-like protein